MKYFFNNEKTGESIDSAIEADLETVIASFKKLPADKSSFLGLENTGGKILQFAWEDNDKWLIDIPDMDTMTTQQKFATGIECVQIIREIFGGKSFAEIGGTMTNKIG
jgi:hypothetical protein